MSKPSTIILTGYRCTGKTAVAGILGKLLNADVLDTDKEIEKKCQCSVSDIFAKEGETGFRDKESEIIAGTLTNRDSNVCPLVLSTGGGAVIRPENRLLLRQNGFVVWLIASPKIIFQRLQGDAKTATLRPSLTSLPMLDEIRTLLEIRRPYYEETAHLTVDTDNHSPEKVADIILNDAFQKFIISPAR